MKISNVVMYNLWCVTMWRQAPTRGPPRSTAIGPPRLPPEYIKETRCN